MTKYKIKVPPEAHVHADNAEPGLFDPVEQVVLSATGRPIPLSSLVPVGPRAKLAKLVKWLRTFMKGENGG